MRGVTTEPTSTVAPPGLPARPRISPGAAASGAIVAFVAVVLVATARSVLAHAFPTFDDSACLAVLYLVVVGAYVAAGWVAVRRSPAVAPVVVGPVATVAAVVAWIPVRVLIWVARDEHRSLLGGHDPALPIGPVVVNLIVAAAAGALGAWWAVQSASRAGAAAHDPVA